MKKRIITIVLCVVIIAALLFGVTRCASVRRGIVDFKSELGNGLDRTITVYTADGNVIAQYEGKIDIQQSDGGYIKFDYNGKRYIYYNCFVETIADI